MSDAWDAARKAKEDAELRARAEREKKVAEAQTEESWRREVAKFKSENIRPVLEEGLRAVSEDVRAIREEDNRITIDLGKHRFQITLLLERSSRTIGYNLDGNPAVHGVTSSSRVRPEEYAQSRGNLENAFRAWLTSHYNELER